MIKRISAFIATAALILSCSGCVVANFSIENPNFIDGIGPMTTMEYPVGQYTAVIIHSEMELYYTSEQSDKIVIEIQENLTEHLDVSVNDGEVTIKADSRFRTDSDKIPKLYISTPELRKIKVEGALSIKQADTVKADSFSFNVSGAADGALSVETGKLVFDASGACDVILTGSAEESTFSISGAGTVDALGLQTKSASVNMSGAGNISVNSSDALDINVSGAGDVSYKGNPQITQNTGGAVSIKRVD